MVSPHKIFTFFPLKLDVVANAMYLLRIEIIGNEKLLYLVDDVKQEVVVFITEEPESFQGSLKCWVLS